MDGKLSKGVMYELFGSESDEEEVNSKVEIHDQANLVSDGGQEPMGEGNTKYKGEKKANRRVAVKGIRRDHLRSSRSHDNEKGKNPAAELAGVIRDVFGDSDDDESMQKKVCAQTKEKKKSPKYKGIYAKKSRVRNAIPDEDETSESEEKRAKPKHKGKGVAPVDVFEIPLRPPAVCPNQIATISLSNFIGIDPKSFDPATYVGEDIYVTDASGNKRCVPPANVIRFREVEKDDGTTSFESNARFIAWDDGSWQLVIGKEAFDIFEQDAEELQSHLFLRHGKEIYQYQGRISRMMKVMPSSSSDLHLKLNKIRLCTPDVDPESDTKQNKKAELRATKASQQLNKKKKKVINKKRRFTSGFLEDSVDKDEQNYDNDPSNDSASLYFGVDLILEAAGMKCLMDTKMCPKDTH